MRVKLSGSLLAYLGPKYPPKTQPIVIAGKILQSIKLLEA